MAFEGLCLEDQAELRFEGGLLSDGEWLVTQFVNEVIPVSLTPMVRNVLGRNSS